MFLLSDIVQEKENRHDCQKETKVKRKCKRKRRHSVLNNPKPGRSLSSDSKSDGDVGNKKAGPEEEEKKKKDSFITLEIKSKSSHSKKRSISSRKEKHRCSRSKKKDSRKCLSKKVSNEIERSDYNGDGAHGNSLLKRLQPMMTTNVSVRKENAVVESVKKSEEDIVQGQELEHGLRKKLQNMLPPVAAVKPDSENNEGSAERENKDNLDIEVLQDFKRHEPEVITVEDSDSEPQVSADMLECDSPEKVNKKDEMEIIGGETSAKVTDDEDEDLVQLRLLALQSNRRKETSKPNVEDDEVMQLRLEALKSAILKKCQVRKQRGVTVKSKKVNTVSSPATSDLEMDSEKDDTCQEALKPEITSVEALRGEPDETTTLVDMDLSHTDDESCAQNEIIIDPSSTFTPLPKDSTSAFLQLTNEYCSKQDVPCTSEPLLKVYEDRPMDLKQNQNKDNVLSAWNPTVGIYERPEAAKFDLESCQVSQVCNNNVQVCSMNLVDCFNSVPPFPQQPLYNELYRSNNSSDLASADLGGGPLDTLNSPFDSCLSSAVPGSFVSSNLNSPGISDALLGSRVEPQVISTKSLIPAIESPSLKTDYTTSKIGVRVSRASSVSVVKDSQLLSTSSITPGTGTEVHRAKTVVYAQVHKMDPTTVSCQSWDRNKKVQLHSKNDLPFKKSLPALPLKPACTAERNLSSVFSVPTKLPFSSMNPQIQEVEGMKAEVPCQSQSVSIQDRESTEHKTDCRMEENSNEVENVDLSNMIVLDEVGQCSSPEAKVEDDSNELVMSKTEGMSQQCEQSSVNVDEDEEILRAKVLTTMTRKPSTYAVPGPSEVFSKPETKTSTLSLSDPPKPISPCSIGSSRGVHQIAAIHRKGKTPSKLPGSLQNFKGCSKITQKLHSKKLEHSQSNLCSYSKGNIRAKWWKKSVKKGFFGASTKQVLTAVNRNPGNMKQHRETSAGVSSNAQSIGMELRKVGVLQCKSIGNPVSRVVFHPRESKPTTIQVTAPTKSVDDQRCKRKITVSAVSSVAPVQHLQRFVIHLGEDSDSQDEDDKVQQMTQAPKRRCVIKSNSSAPVLTVSTSAMCVAPRDPPVNCDGTIAPSSRDHPLSDKQNTCSVLTQPVSTSGISADFEKSVDMFLKQARKSQEARVNSVIQKNLTPNRSTRQKFNPMVSSVTPLVSFFFVYS